MAYAAIGAVSGAAGGGAGAGIGSAFGAFWGTLASGAAGGFVGGFGNASYAGASFGQALAFGGIAAVIAAGTSAAVYGGVRVAGKVIDAAQNASRTRAAASGTKTPIGQQGKGSAASSLNANKGESASESQALSSRRVKIDVRIEGVEPTGYRYVGSGEVEAAARTGYVPSTTETGAPKTVFYTPDEPINSASQAAKTYNLEGVRTHRIGLDTTKTTNIYGGNVEGGTGIEMATDQKIPVVDIQTLSE